MAKNILILAVFCLEQFTYSQMVKSEKSTAITDGDTLKLLTKDSTLLRIGWLIINCQERKEHFYKKSEAIYIIRQFRKLSSAERPKARRLW